MHTVAPPPAATNEPPPSPTGTLHKSPSVAGGFSAAGSVAETSDGGSTRGEIAAAAALGPVQGVRPSQPDSFTPFVSHLIQREQKVLLSGQDEQPASESWATMRIAAR
jgi:hypothetical protein